jgi:predicted dehydrogenase
MTSAAGQAIRWGILGGGEIARTFAGEIALSPGNRVAAVGARSMSRARALAATFAECVSYGSYFELVADPEIDVVYIASTHPFHREHALLAIDSGKAVLIEKPVSLNAAAAREIFRAARQANVFAMEAMWMRINPLVREAHRLVADGAIGDVAFVRAEHGLGLAYDSLHRLYNLNNGGGALLDLGIYPITFAHLFLGSPTTVAVTGELADSGCDATVAMQWEARSGATAHLWCSAPVLALDQAVIYGTTGWIRTEGAFYRPRGLLVHSAGQLRRIADPIAGQGEGYGPEIVEVARCLRAGLLESPLVPHDDTVAIMDLLDSARAALGVRYPGE